MLPAIPAPAYNLTGRRTWIWTRLVPEQEKQRALETSLYLIVTNPPATTSPLETLRQKFKGPPAPPPEPVFESHSGQSTVWPSVLESSDLIIKEISSPSETLRSMENGACPRWRARPSALVRP